MARILVVEDDQSFLDLLRIHLSRAGHVVLAARDPAIALRHVIDDPPDLIVSDLNLPYLHGLELLETLRTDPAAQAIPVVVISGRSDDDAYSRCLRMGISDYFTKPVNSDSLLEAIARKLLPGRSPLAA